MLLMGFFSNIMWKLNKAGKWLKLRFLLLRERI